MQTEHGARSDSAQPTEECLQTPSGAHTLRTRVVVSESEADQSGYVLMTAEDVTYELAAHAQSHHMAHHDTLTGLANRTLFAERLHEALAESSVGQSLVGVLCLDLDNFKDFNDALGHAFGDRLLRSLARGSRAPCAITTPWPGSAATNLPRSCAIWSTPKMPIAPPSA